MFVQNISNKTPTSLDSSTINDHEEQIQETIDNNDNPRRHLDSIYDISRRAGMTQALSEVDPQFGSFPDASMNILKFKEIAQNIPLAHQWETEIALHADSDPEMDALRKARNERHEAGFSYDAVQIGNSPKMVLHRSLWRVQKLKQ